MIPSVSPAPEFLVDGRRRLYVSVVTETYPPEVNGVALTVQQFVHGLLAQGHRVQLVRPRQPIDADIPVDEASQDFELILHKGLPLPFYKGLHLGLPAGKLLQRLWRQTTPDLVHLVTEGPLGASALNAARRLNIPITSAFHTNFHSYSHHYGLGFLRDIITVYLRRFHNRCHCTLVPTAQLKAQLETMGFDNIRILSRGIDTERFTPARRSQALRQRWGAQGDDPVVLYVGRLAAEKNLEFGVKAFFAMRDRHPGARFVLVGDGPLRESLEGRYPDLIFPGMLSGDDLVAHYASADIFLFPSLTETFGNVILEAMASGLAVVAYDYAAAETQIQHGVNGLKVPVGDEKAFVAEATALVGDSQRIKVLGDAARESVMAQGWQRVTLDLEQLFLEFAEMEPS